MAKAFELITTTTVGSGGAANIEFSSIPSTYTDLLVVYSLRVTLSGGPYYFSDCGLRMGNGTIDTGSNYNNTVVRSREGTVGSFGSTSANLISLTEASAGNATANSFGSGQFYIANYSSSKFKSVSLYGGSETNTSPSNAVQNAIIAGTWKSSSAVNIIRLYDQNGTNFVQYSSASLYGIKNA